MHQSFLENISLTYLHSNNFIQSRFQPPLHQYSGHILGAPVCISSSPHLHAYMIWSDTCSSFISNSCLADSNIKVYVIGLTFKKNGLTMRANTIAFVSNKHRKGVQQTNYSTNNFHAYLICHITEAGRPKIVQPISRLFCCVNNIN